MQVDTYSFKALTGWPIILLKYKTTLMKPWCCLMYYLNLIDVCSLYEMQTVNTSLRLLVKDWCYSSWVAMNGAFLYLTTVC